MTMDYPTPEDNGWQLTDEGLVYHCGYLVLSFYQRKQQMYVDVKRKPMIKKLRQRKEEAVRPPKRNISKLHHPIQEIL